MDASIAGKTGEVGRCCKMPSSTTLSSLFDTDETELLPVKQGDNQQKSYHSFLVFFFF